MPIPLQHTFPLLIAAAIVCYGGTRLFWTGVGGPLSARPLSRGMALSVLIGALAMWATWIGAAGSAVSLLLTASVVMVTLGLGVAAMSVPPGGGVASPNLRLLAPMAAAACLIGFSGELRLEHALALLLLGSALRLAVQRQELTGQPVRMTALLAGILILAAGATLMILAMRNLHATALWAISGPVIVLLVLLSTVGLLASDAHVAAPSSAAETVIGFVLGTLGFALPAVIVVAQVLALGPLHAVTYATAPATTQPAIVMPVIAWRIDSVLLTVLGILLLPAAQGRLTLGRLEGTLLVLLCMAYLIVSVGVIRLH
jgi:hypothetical protein